MRTKVTNRGQVSIPAAVRRKLGIGQDSQLEWVIEGNALRVIPIPADPIAAFRGSGKKLLVRALVKDRERDGKRENGLRKDVRA